MVLQCSNHGDIGSFSEMTIEIGSIRSILEEEVRNRTKFENRRVLVQVHLNDIDNPCLISLFWLYGTIEEEENLLDN